MIPSNMSDDNQGSTTAQSERLTTILTGLPWIEILAQAWKLGRKIMRGLADEGMYEVLEYETTLELQDRRGEYALLRKREKVRYLQNNIIAFQDQAWADGKILVNYCCTPGVPVDRYRPGRQTYILAARSQLSQATFDAAWKRGQAMTLAQVITFALTSDNTAAFAQ
jgi:hypothetical protein